NVGHLRNYNIGIEQARGKYLWLISADDRLRSAKVLERFVNVFEADPEVTLAFCSGLYLTADGREGAVIGRAYDRDCIVASDVFVGGAIKYNLVCTPGAMAHTQSYRDLGVFPLDLPFAGDWLAWCLFGCRGKVAYFDDPMVHYRVHDGSNTSLYRRERIEQIA